MSPDPALLVVSVERVGYGFTGYISERKNGKFLRVKNEERVDKTGKSWVKMVINMSETVPLWDGRLENEWMGSGKILPLIGL